MKESMKDGLNMRTSTIFFLFAVLQFILLSLITAHAISRKVGAIPRFTEQQQAVAREPGLTDLSLAPEARHARPPALVGQHSPLPAGPLSFEHLPAKTLAGPPPVLLARGNRH